VSNDRTPRAGVSVIVVSDHAAGAAKGWDDIRAALAGLARQDFGEPVEFLLVESERFHSEFPPELTSPLPDLRVCFVPDYSSYSLKNEGVRMASGEYVAILDADCVPEPDWLRRLIATLRAHPRAAAVSGRTAYAGRTFVSRVCGLLARSYLDPGSAGRTRFIAINSCALRRAAYQSHPLPTGIGSFSSRLQSEALLHDGWELRFDPEIHVTHDFEGLSMEVDLRRNAGYGTIATRLRDSSLPWARLARFGPIAIPLILAGKIFDSWKDCLRCGRSYRIHWFELPAAMLASIAIHLLEVPGMWRGYYGRGLRNSHFR
jgi:glycosyltransferase involved in cell wall biosynthesis